MKIMTIGQVGHSEVSRLVFPLFKISHSHGKFINKLRYQLYFLQQESKDIQWLCQKPVENTLLNQLSLILSYDY